MNKNFIGPRIRGVERMAQLTKISGQTQTSIKRHG
jgi:hypothetical protein